MSKQRLQLLVSAPLRRAEAGPADAPGQRRQLVQRRVGHEGEHDAPG